MNKYQKDSILLPPTTWLRYIPHGNSAIYLVNTGGPRGDVEYVAISKNGIALVLANNEDVPNLMSRKAGCCGNERLAFRVATQAEINLYLGATIETPEQSL